MKIEIGNIFESNAKTLVNTINCVGVMGKGIALEFKKRYPQLFEEYAQRCSVGTVLPGQPYLYTDLLGNSILQFPTKNHWRTPSQLSYITSGLDWFRDNYKKYGITSIAFPPLGCGNGGLDWEIVGPIMYEKLKDLPIDITIYAPYGTAPEKATIPYLENHQRKYSENITGNQAIKINHYWYLIPYMVQQLNNDLHSLSVGRVILQKICFVLTRAGIPTGFHFTQNSYGPFSHEVKNAITALTNANIIYEVQSHKMICVQVAPDFHLNEEQYSVEEMAIVNNCLDLLSRIKNTDQAEMMATVIFSFDTLTKSGPVPTEMQIVDYVENWKPHWKTEKHSEIVSTIKGLSELRWITPDYSKDFIPEEDCF